MLNGVDVNPITGRPRMDKHEEIVRQKQTEAIEIMGELSGETGQKLIALIKEMLIDRVDMLTKSDPISSNLIEILSRLGYMVNIAPEYAQMVIDKKLRIRSAP